MKAFTVVRDDGGKIEGHAPTYTEPDLESPLGMFLLAETTDSTRTHTHKYHA